MPSEQEVAAASQGLSAGLALITLFLGLRQRYEQKARGGRLSPEDLDHYASQDRRRWSGIVTLAAIAASTFIASRTPLRIQGKGNLFFIVIWVVVLVLIVVLLILALTDWKATRRYDRRLRRQLLRESIEDIRRDRQETENQTREPSQGEH
jgi:UDP-N-acetylmuramyl pentapeptide phosphotransferase/UDP-N-acetylglucosamine-1-phosphate transferase